MFFRLFVTVWGSTVTRNFLGRLRSKIKTAIVGVDKHFNDHKRVSLLHFHVVVTGTSCTVTQTNFKIKFSVSG